MAAISIKHLFEAGVHFGHKTRKWHPKMKEYIYGAKSGIYIIDLRQTLAKLKEAYEYVYNISANGGKVLFVGTKFQARDIIENESKRSNNFFVNYRWLGGMLTNFSTIKQSIGKLKRIEEIAGQDHDYAGVLKKEAVRMERSRKKLDLVLKGIVDLRKNPAAIFIIDIRRESIAFKEAKKLGIPVIAVVDTNCNPAGVDYIIPGNDDSIHCIKLFTSVIASGAIEGRKVFDLKLNEIKKEKDKKKLEEQEKKARIKAKKVEPKPTEKTVEAKKVEPKAEKIAEPKKVEPEVEKPAEVEKTESEASPSTETTEK
jgi:small subunit ribosomal protein S2